MQKLAIWNTSPSTVIFPPSNEGKSFFNQQGNTVLIDELHHVVPTHSKPTEKETDATNPVKIEVDIVAICKL